MATVKPLTPTMIRTLEAIHAKGGEMNGYGSQGNGFHLGAADGLVKRGLLERVDDCATCVANVKAMTEWFAQHPLRQADGAPAYIPTEEVAAYRASLPRCERPVQGDAATTACYMRVRINTAGLAAIGKDAPAADVAPQHVPAAAAPVPADVAPQQVLTADAPAAPAADVAPQHVPTIQELRAAVVRPWSAVHRASVIADRISSAAAAWERLAPIVTGIYGRATSTITRTGRLLEVTLRERRWVHVRLDHVNGPIVRLTPEQFAALGRVSIGYHGLAIGDAVKAVRVRDGQVLATGTLESFTIAREDVMVGLMVHHDGCVTPTWLNTTFGHVAVLPLRDAAA